MDNLAENHSILDQAFMKSPMGMAVLTSEGRWIKVNPAFCNIIGYTETELLAGTLFCWIDNQEGHQGVPALTEVMDDLLHSPNANRVREQRFLNQEVGQDSMNIIVYAQDITDRKIADQLTVDSRDLYDLFIKDDQSIISFILPDGVFSHPEDVEGMKHSSVILSKDTLVRRLRHKEGHYLWLEISFHVIRDKNNEITRIMGIGRNVSDRKQNEAALATAHRVARMGSWIWDIPSRNSSISEELRRILQQRWEKISI